METGAAISQQASIGAASLISLARFQLDESDVPLQQPAVRSNDPLLLSKSSLPGRAPSTLEAAFATSVCKPWPLEVAMSESFSPTSCFGWPSCRQHSQQQNQDAQPRDKKIKTQTEITTRT